MLRMLMLARMNEYTEFFYELLFPGANNQRRIYDIKESRINLAHSIPSQK